MSDVVIRAEGLGKKYIIGHERERYNALRDVMVRTARNFARSAMDMARGRQLVTGDEVEEFWALRDVDFEVRRGDVVGIVGRNGAGKSTLLKVLSRITEPTTGRVEIRGRVASLLEVGTGFHPELTGRENIYLNGAILGMSRAEIRAKFDEIVAFADIAKFLDTPIKRYSSGMYVRLAFAVAAHLEPEILIIDEVLAVGDAEFQKRCLGKMESVARDGRTVFFVSHNMSAVAALCNRAIALKQGRVVEQGQSVAQVVNNYLNSANVAKTKWTNSGMEYRNSRVKPIAFYLGDANGNPIDGVISNNDDAFIYIDAEITEASKDLEIGYAIYGSNNEIIYRTMNHDAGEGRCSPLRSGRICLRSSFPKRLLNEGVYFLEIAAAFYRKEWIIQPSVTSPRISVEISGGLSDSPMWLSPRGGPLAPVLEWKLFNKSAYAVPESISA